MFRRHRLRALAYLTAAALPFWIHSAGETVGSLQHTPLTTLQQQRAALPLSLLRWSLDLSDPQRESLEKLTAAAAPELTHLEAQFTSAQMAALLTTADAPTAARRQRELAQAEVNLIHAQRLLERRLRSQLDFHQVAKIERWEERARLLHGFFPRQLGTLLAP